MPTQIPRPTPKSIASYVKKNAPAVRKAQKHHHMNSTSVREAEYKGHHIVVTTTYNVTVDGMPIMGHLGVTNDGSVHYHPVPNMKFDSAIDLVKQLIEVFPDDFPATPVKKRHGSGGMGGMDMGKPRKTSPKQKKR